MDAITQQVRLEKQQELKEKILQTERDKQEHTEKGHASTQLVVFRLGEEEYALQIEEIKEVVLTPGITQIPQVPEYIRGVANIRGNILAILDLEARLGISASGTTTPKFTLVLDDEAHKVGILVREVPNTVAVPEKSLDDSNPFIKEAGIDERAIQALAKVGTRLIILLNINNILGTHDSLLQEVSQLAQQEPGN